MQGETSGGALRTADNVRAQQCSSHSPAAAGTGRLPAVPAHQMATIRSRVRLLTRDRPAGRGVTVTLSRSFELPQSAGCRTPRTRSTSSWARKAVELPEFHRVEGYAASMVGSSAAHEPLRGGRKAPFGRASPRRARRRTQLRPRRGAHRRLTPPRTPTSTARARAHLRVLDRWRSRPEAMLREQAGALRARLGEPAQRIGPEQRGQVSTSAAKTCASSHAQRLRGAGASSRSPSGSRLIAARGEGLFAVASRVGVGTTRRRREEWLDKTPK